MSSSYLSFPTSTPPPLVCLLKSIDDFRLCYPSHCHRPYIPIAVQLPQLHHTLCERGHCRVTWSCLSLTAQTHSYITPLPCLLLSLPVAQSKCAAKSYLEAPTCHLTISLFSLCLCFWPNFYHFLHIFISGSLSHNHPSISSVSSTPP